MSLCLTKDELVELTDYKQRVKQIEALVYMDVPFRLDPRGNIKVLRSDLEAGVRNTKDAAWRSKAMQAIYDRRFDCHRGKP